MKSVFLNKKHTHFYHQAKDMLESHQCCTRHKHGPQRKKKKHNLALPPLDTALRDHLVHLCLEPFLWQNPAGKLTVFKKQNKNLNVVYSLQVQLACSNNKTEL